MHSHLCRTVASADDDSHSRVGVALSEPKDPASRLREPPVLRLAIRGLDMIALGIDRENRRRSRKRRCRDEVVLFSGTQRRRILNQHLRAVDVCRRDFRQLRARPRNGTLNRQRRDGDGVVVRAGDNRAGSDGKSVDDGIALIELRIVVYIVRSVDKNEFALVDFYDVETVSSVRERPPADLA